MDSLKIVLLFFVELLALAFIITITWYYNINGIHFTPDSIIKSFLTMAIVTIYYLIPGTVAVLIGIKINEIVKKMK